MRGREASRLAVAVAAVVLAGCGSGGSNVVRSAGDDIGRLARGGGADDVAAARSGLEQLRQQGDAVDDALASALCEGATSIANTGELPSGAEWGEFLIGEVESSVVGVSHDVVEDKVEQLMAAAELSQVSGAASVRYARLCAGRL